MRATYLRPANNKAFPLFMILRIAYTCNFFILNGVQMELGNHFIINEHVQHGKLFRQEEGIIVIEA